MKKIGFLSFGFSVLMVFEVNAGFQFTPPVKQEKPQIQMMGNSEGLLPLISNEDNDAPAMPAVPKPPIATTPVIKTLPPQPAMTARPSPIVENQPTSDYEMAVGFGSDLPLVSALRQVIPSQYTYVMDDDIGLGQTVSWNGGQEWPVVLNDMLDPLNLSSAVDGNIVKITQASLPEVTPTSTPNPASRAPIPMVTTPQMTVTPEPIIPPETAAILENPVLKQQKPNIAWNDPAPAQVEKNVVAEMQKPSQPPVNIVKSQMMEINDAPVIVSEIEAIDTGALPPMTQSPNVDFEPIQPAIQAQKIDAVKEAITTQWTAESGQTLKNVLEAWANLAGVDLFWSTDYNYTLLSDVKLRGSFENVVTQLLDGFAQAMPKPKGRLHPNLPNGPAVLIVETSEV